MIPQISVSFNTCKWYIITGNPYGRAHTGERSLERILANLFEQTRIDDRTQGMAEGKLDIARNALAKGLSV